MKHLLLGSLAALVIALPAFANSSSTTTTTETMKSSSATPAGSDVQAEEARGGSVDSSSMTPAGANDAQMQQAPHTDESMKKETKTTTEEVED